ncbi:hypothetical protein Xentx_03285 [Xenorhabdus thuongxuanensis]|uniref:Uncharacterized protein n=1 Tax=Xenorhabdus thuongxuanensis TaxID=1873484 RepID=A0A1Q5TPF4_9GAMM|nr:hypothetical protein Xentx_03285 [Xenorhabdus thuongxuanensis]
MWIQDINLGIGNRTTNRNGTGYLNGRGNLVGGRKRGGFRRAISIYQVGRLGCGQLHLLYLVGIEYIPANQQIAQLPQQGLKAVEIFIEQAHSQPERGNTAPNQRLAETCWIEQYGLWHHLQVSPIEQGGPDFPG